MAKKSFLAKFDWNSSILAADQKNDIESILVEFEDIFPRHRFDVGYNMEMRVKLTPEHLNPVYMQSPPTPIHLKDEMIIGLSLLLYYGIITTLTDSKYSSTIFAWRKPSAKLRILHDLRRINHLLEHDYANHNFPISNITDALNHFAGKQFFTILDCSQAYQMADPLSAQLLAFDFASRTYAYQVLVHRLNKSVTGFSAFVRKYFNPCLAAKVCTQFMDDIGSGVETFVELKSNLQKIFSCIRGSGLKLSPQKCHFGVSRISFFDNTKTPQWYHNTTEKKIEKFLQNLRIPQTVKQMKRLIGFTQFSRNFIPKLNEKLLP